MHRRRTGTWAILAATLALATGAVAGEVNSLSKEEIADGWILLFDGATTFGWEAVGGAKWNVAAPRQAQGAVSLPNGEGRERTHTTDCGCCRDTPQHVPSGASGSSRQVPAPLGVRS